MKRFLVALALATLPISSQAQPFGRILHYAARHKELIFADAVIVAAWSADAASTVNDERNCPTCIETNPFLGPHPTKPRLWFSAVGFAGVETTVNHLIWHYAPDPVYRHMIWAQPIMLGSIEANNVTGNVQAAQAYLRFKRYALRQAGK